MNGVPAEQAEAVAVAWRMHDWQAHPAIRVGGVLMRDELAGPHRGPRRVFWLLDEGVQLIYEPFGWIDEWYVDVVCIQARRDDGQLVYHVTDEYADIIVEGMGPAYRMIDLDQLADAMSAASIDTARAAEALRCAQRFVDRYLHRGGPFPPPQIRGFFASDHRYPPLPRPAGSDDGPAPPATPEPGTPIARRTMLRVTSRSAEVQHLRDLARLRRVRDRIDREYAQPLDVEALARGAHMSAGHLSREFKAAYGESPYSYLMTRRIERAMALLRRGDLSVTEVCFAVGCASLGTFSTRFTELVGMPPSTYRSQAAGATAGMPPCVAKQVTKPVRNREAPVIDPQLA